MDRKFIKKMIFGKKDIRLPEDYIVIDNEQIVWQDTSLMNEPQMGISLKMIYSDVQAPLGFSERLMDKIREEKRAKKVLPFSIEFKKMLTPFVAVAACAVLLIGLFADGVFTPSVRDTQIALVDEPVQEIPIDQTDNEVVVAQVPYVNGDQVSEETIPEAALVEEPIEVDEPVLEDAVVAENGQKEEEELPPAPVVVAEAPAAPPAAPVQRNAPIALTTVAVPVSVTVEEPVVSIPKPPVEAVQTVEEALPTVFDKALIPDADVFVNRKRTINSTLINVSVLRIDAALTRLEQIESTLSLKADLVETNLRPDGTIVMVRSYAVPQTTAMGFVNRLTALGIDAKTRNDNADITFEYNLLLQQHRESSQRAFQTGKGFQETNEIISQLMFLNRRSTSGMRNIVVFLEDGVDF